MSYEAEDKTEEVEILNELKRIRELLVFIASIVAEAAEENFNEDKQ